LRALGAATVLAAALGPVGGVAAADLQASNPSQAVPLTQQLTGHLNPAGSFAYYRFTYPADGSVATVNMNVTPDDAALLQDVGFHVYGPDGRLIVTGGPQPGLQPDLSADVITTDASEKGDYIVQVFDYDPTRPADFTIWLNGVAMQPSTAAAPAPSTTAPTAPAAPAAPVAAQTPAAAQPGGAMKGQLGPGGTSAQYEFNYPGDDSVYTINLNITPNDPSVLELAGFEVYDPNGALVVKGGDQPGLTPNVLANVISRLPGRYVVKVFNYHPTSSIQYEASITTAPPPEDQTTT
jgi:hypothetical protein